MYIKYLRAAIIAVIIITMTTSCDEEVGTKDFPPYFTTSSSYFTSDDIKELTIDYEGLVPVEKKPVIKLVTTVPWEAKSNAEWLKLSHSSGEYNTDIELTAQENSSLTDGRTTTINFIPEEGEMITITVFQKEWEAKIFTNLANLSPPTAGQKGNINVRANTSWTATTDVDWVIIDSENGEGNKTVGYEVLKNETGNSRNATITFTSTNGEKIVKVSITQAK